MKSIFHLLLIVAVGLAGVTVRTSGQTGCEHPTTRAWIRVSDAAGYFDTLWFGFHPTATSCIDTHLCEGDDFSPPPPVGFFYSAMLLPQWCFPNMVKHDYRRYVSRTHVESYEVYFRPTIPPGYPMTVRWSSSAVAALCDSAILTDEFGGLFVRARMHQVDSVHVTMSGISQLLLSRYGAKGRDSLSLSVLAGWNMLALPITVPDRSVSAVFPTATSRAFSYQRNLGYVMRDTLDYGGVGYWLKFASGGPMTLRGTFRVLDTIRVVAGWNLIGNTISYPVPTDSIIQIPPGIVRFCPPLPPPYYLDCDTLRVGKATWVKASSDGLLILRRVGNAAGAVRR